MRYLRYEIENLLKHQPSLRAFRDGDLIKLEGKFILKSNEEIIDDYFIRIEFPNSFSLWFPKVFEIKNKIPPIPDRHKNSDGSLCFTVFEEEFLICKKGISLTYFIYEILTPHLARETFRELKGHYPDGEYKHGFDGRIQFYYEKFDIKDKEELVSIFKWALLPNNKLPINKSDLCICGKNVKYELCHLPMIYFLVNNYPYFYLKEFLENLLKHEI